MSNSKKTFITKKSGSYKNGLNNIDEDPAQLMEEFESLYKKKLCDLQQTRGGSPALKIEILEDWISDLTAQNKTLVKTVQNLECEALKRVNAFENLAVAARESSLHLDDVASDLTQLLELLRRMREEERFCTCGLHFKTVTFQDVFGVNNSRNQGQWTITPCVKSGNPTSEKKIKWSDKLK